MAEFRRGHSGQSNKSRKGGKKGNSGMLKAILMVAVLFGFLAWAAKKIPLSGFDQHMEQNTEADYKPKYQDPATQIRHFLPTTKNGTEVHHTYYSLSYSEQHEQAEWVAYELTVDQLNHSKVSRTDWFEEDHAVSTRSAHFEDYRNSGFTKGHLAPAGDMAFSRQAMDESFLMSNMSPQKRAFNGGIWRELEENVRDWARRHGHVYIVTGPVLSDKNFETIGPNHVAVPQSYYKVIFADDVQNPQAIGFLISNDVSEKPLRDYIMSVDNIEAMTGLDFFGNMFQSKEDEAIVESAVNEKYWPIDEKRFEKRINSWNIQ